MPAIVAAILFAIALLMVLAASVFITGGLLCLAPHAAGATGADGRAATSG